jgi:hypothetical protein
MKGRSALRRAAPLAAALLLAAAPAAGQDRTDDRAAWREARQATRIERQAARRDAALTRLAERLDLTDAQKAAVGEVIQVDEETGRAGDGWTVAAVLARDLTSTQVDKLFEASDEAGIYRRGMAEGYRRGAGQAGRHANRVAERPALGPEAVAKFRDARIEGMRKALDLTDDQVRVLRIHDALAGVMGAGPAAVEARTGIRRGFRGDMRFGR